MASISNVSAVSKIFTKLGDNTGSLIPMYAKDVSSAALTSLTYYKEGGAHDGAEKTLEEFGTGIIWLGGIPFVKKIFDKTICKKAGIDPRIDAKRLFSKKDKTGIDSVEFAKEKACSLGKSFGEQAEILTDTIKNKKLAKMLSVSKFGIATALTGFGLYGLISFKQKRTEKEIEKQVKQKHAKEQVLKNALNNEPVYQAFKGGNEPSFKGLGTLFMTNPIANTLIVDGVISGTRIAKARKGEKGEVGLKEGCEIAFIYGLARPLQKGFEFISKAAFKKPIELDYSVLDSNTIKEAIEIEKQTPGSSELLKQAKGIIDSKTPKDVIDFAFDNKNAKMADIFKKTGDIGTFVTKEGTEQLSILSSIDTNKLKTTAKNTAEVIQNGALNNDTAKYLKQTKFLKGAAIIANICLSAILMGYLQPKLNLHLRKKNNNGDNTNPAIRDLTAQMEKKLAFEADA